MDPAWFLAFVGRCRQRQSLPSVEAWVAAHDHQPATAVPPKPPARYTHSGVTPRLQYSPRNDARTSAGVSGLGVDISFPPGSSSIDNYNLFADLALHDQAAATIASASQKKSGFSATMSMEQGVAVNKFVDYLNDFIAPHWLMSYYKEHQVHHQSTSHSKFVDDLVDIVVEGLKAVGGDQDAAGKAADSVRSLAKRLTSSSSREERLTLFSNFWMDRPNSSDPVVYGIFYTTLEARYEQNGKTEVLSSSTYTYSVVFTLISGVLIANEKAYNTLLKSSVDEWLSGHTI